MGKDGRGNKFYVHCDKCIFPHEVTPLGKWMVENGISKPEDFPRINEKKEEAAHEG